MFSWRKRKNSFLDAPFIQGPVIQSIVRLTSLLVAKMLTIPVSTISDSQVFLLKKCFADAKATHIFQHNDISLYAIFIDQSFNNTLTNFISFEQLGPEQYDYYSHTTW